MYFFFPCDGQNNSGIDRVQHCVHCGVLQSPETLTTLATWECPSRHALEQIHGHIQMALTLNLEECCFFIWCDFYRVLFFVWWYLNDLQSDNQSSMFLLLRDPVSCFNLWIGENGPKKGIRRLWSRTGQLCIYLRRSNCSFVCAKRS